MHYRFKLLPLTCLLSLVLSLGTIAEETQQNQELYASVGGENITTIELDEAVNRRVRTTLYHGEPSSEQLSELRDSVAAELVLKTLLKKEAVQQGIEEDSTALEQSLSRMAGYMQQRNRWKH